MTEPDRLLATKVAEPLPTDEIHLWMLPHGRADGRRPLREVLARYVGGRSPDTLELAVDMHGRPGLVDGGGLDFNWSHTRGLAVVAVACGVRPGVDVEWRRPVPRAVELGRRFFAPAEAQWLERCAPADREAAFLRLWTAKEAVLKALGRGLAFGLDRLEFDLDGGHVKLRRLADETPAAWTVLPIAPPEGFVGALAWRGPPRRVRYRTLAEGG